MPRYRRYFQPNQIVFLTIVSANRAPWMGSDTVCEQLLHALRATRALYPFHHHGHVILPDHLHLLLSPLGEVSASTIVGTFKRAALARLHGRNLIRGGRYWQRRFHDHVIRDADDFSCHLDYLHFNPVKHGHVDRADQWRWSSLAEWQRRGAYASDWGRTEPRRIAGMTE